MGGKEYAQGDDRGDGRGVARVRGARGGGRDATVGADDVCPEGRSLGLFDAQGNRLCAMTCEQIHAQLAARGVTPESGEHVGKAREPWSPLGLLCSVVVGGFLAYRCNETYPNDWMTCTAVSLVPAALCEFF